MKRITTILITLSLLTALTGCTAQAEPQETIYQQSGIVKAVNDNYAEVIDIQGGTWAIEVDPDTETGQELIFWNNNNGTQDTEDDLTLIAFSSQFFGIIQSITVDSITDNKAVLEVVYDGNRTTMFDVDNLGLKEKQIIYQKIQI